MSDELESYDFIRPRFLARALARLLDYWVPRLVDRIVAVSDDMRRFLLERGIDGRRIQLIPLGVDPELFARCDPAVMRRRYHASDGPLIMYTGILEPLQRVDYLLKAMTLVTRQRPDARLLLVVNLARDEQVRECEASIRSLGLESHARIVRSDSFDEIPMYLAAADITVVPRPRCPGFPVKLLNYMAARKPVVLFEGSAKGLAHLEEAYVVEDHDWEGLGRGILCLAENPDTAERLARNAYQRVVRDYAWPAPAERTIELYRDVLSEVRA
jgi:glycosyltransferase involved in cell wall biosynthesis